ncbi:MAG: flagellar hook-basal body protein [Oscillospiraceae bacterium]|nr:flagellar hook-basal body protein [Oscillospiraceae bacterium]
MNIGFYNGVSGLMASQAKMDVLANNMANINTSGFKASRVNFQDLLYTEMYVNNEEPELVGHGAKASSVDLLFEQGMMNSTGRELDFAIVGDGFFGLQTPQGETVYTRNGAFQIQLAGNRGYLVSTDGSYVLDTKGKPITLKKKDGTDTFDTEGLLEKLGVYTFENPYGLSPTSGSSFYPTELSGEANLFKGKKEDATFEVRQYTLERSNVDTAQQMVDVIMTQKAYQFNARVIQTADQMDEIINTLRG